MKSILLILIIFGIVLVSGCAKEDIRCDFEAYKKSIDMGEVDMWACKMEVNGVFYNKETCKCIYQQSSACKNPYPFTTIEKCEKICLKKKDIEEPSQQVYDTDYVLDRKEELEGQKIFIKGFARHPVPDCTPEGTDCGTYLLLVNKSTMQKEFIDPNMVMSLIRILDKEYNGKKIGCYDVYPQFCYPLENKKQYLVEGIWQKDRYGYFVLNLTDFNLIEEETQNCADIDKKIHPNLQEKLKGWFVNEDGSVKVQVLCNEESNCTELIERYNGTIYQQSAPWMLDINLPNNSINKLACEPDVEYIGRGNTPAIPNSE